MSCLLAGGCKKYQCGDIRRAIDAEAIGPFVTITISGNGREITVGNKSSPAFGHKAVIRSFQYGENDGFGVRIEIVDEDGGAFTEAFNNMFGSLDELKAKYGRITAKWGWVDSRCETGGELPTSDIHYFALYQVDIKFEETYKFVLEGVDAFTAINDASRHDKSYGTDDNPMKLKDALIQMFSNNNPPIKDVKFLRRLPTGGTEPWEFKKEPKGTWKSSNQSPMGVARRWISGYTTDKDKGITVSSDSKNKNMNIIFWEDFNPKCNQIEDCKANNIGTFVVNGGECSPVIEFNPTIHWPLAVVGNTGGHADEKVTGRNWKQNDEDECDLNDEGEGGHRTGLQTTNVAPQHHIRNYGKESGREFRKNERRNTRANPTYSLIDADLRIQGDPQLDKHLELRGAFTSVIVINPFHLDDAVCPEWTSSGGRLAASSCNQVMSNRNWQILGLSHEIRLGSYTTTLHLRLAAPGVNLNRDLPLGGSSSGYKLPKS